MSQKRAKLIKRYTQALGMDNTGRALKIPTPGNPNRVVIHRDDKILKKAYAGANWKEKTEAGLEAKEVISLAKQNAENLNRRPQTPTQGSQN
jgi:hypothetical protein